MRNLKGLGVIGIVLLLALVVFGSIYFIRPGKIGLSPGENVEIVKNEAIHSVNDPYFTYFRYNQGGYGLSQTIGVYEFNHDIRSSLTEQEKRRVLADSFFGVEKITETNYGTIEPDWLNYYKQFYDANKEEYLSGNFDPNPDWPIDPETGWFRNIEKIYVVYEYLHPENIEIKWMTDHTATSEIAWSGVPENWADPAGELKNEILTMEHEFNINNFNLNNYKLRVRSRNGEGPANEIIWGCYDCSIAYCGDGVIDQDFESCDDGNTERGDGCSRECLLEVQEPFCGDGLINVEGEECDDQNGLSGDGCYLCKNESYFKVFTTSQEFTGRITYGSYVGVIAADMICSNNSRAAGHDARMKWKAWLSSSTQNASQRLHHSSRAYKNLNGEIIANGWNDLTDGNLINPLNVNEFGQKNFELQDRAWTGTTITGAGYADNCNSWSSNSSGYIGGTGFVSTNLSGWSLGASIGCDRKAHLYCFEQPWCGNGIIDQVSELCDDGNLINTDGCTNLCRLPATSGGSPGKNNPPKEVVSPPPGDRIAV